MKRLWLTGVLVVAALAGTAAAPDEVATATHVLNRLTFGARPGDVDRMRAIGVARWIDRQLHPERIDDRAAEARLPTLEDAPGGSTPEELRRFARRQIETLASAKLLRAMYSERQLQEVLADFWLNHFNVYAAKGRTAIFLPEYERDIIAPHVFDRFRDLLGAIAKSPAMLVYLDNRLNSAGESNENYARELLELHTLGVDGGYTQKDVVEVARAFTGWTTSRTGHFRFVGARHDRGDKVVLGHPIKAGGGIDDGERVLDIVASHPATARHIAFKLAQRLVADQPPAALVERAAKRFTDTNGDLREVVKTIVTSPEFLAPAVRDAKFKTPFEFVVSAVRTTGMEVTDARPFLRTLQQLGQPLYMCQPPTGYDHTAVAWVSAGGLVTRMNFATRLASGDTQMALRIGSPEFQRH